MRTLLLLLFLGCTGLLSSCTASRSTMTSAFDAYSKDRADLLDSFLRLHGWLASHGFSPTADPGLDRVAGMRAGATTPDMVDFWYVGSYSDSAPFYLRVSLAPQGHHLSGAVLISGKSTEGSFERLKQQSVAFTRELHDFADNVPRKPRVQP